MKELAIKIGFKNTKELRQYYNVKKFNSVYTLVNRMVNVPNRHFNLVTLEEVY